MKDSPEIQDPPPSGNAWGGRAKALIQAATSAPSSHNTQPWVFRLGASQIELLADRTRALPINDPSDRELTISNGCALMNLRVAAAHHGMTPRVELMPDPSQPDLLARILLEQGAPRSRSDALLFEYLELRRTYRKAFTARAVEEDVRKDLEAAAGMEQASLRTTTDRAERHRVAQLAAEGDRQQWANADWRRELAAWMRPRTSEDGLTVPTWAAPMTRMMVRTFDLGRWVAARDRRRAEACPLLAILCTERDETRDWLQAGQALQRVLLTACRHGLQASYLNQPVQVSGLRPRLQEISSGLTPQVVLCLGYPTRDPSPTSRRPLSKVVQDTED